MAEPMLNNLLVQPLETVIQPLQQQLLQLQQQQQSEKRATSHTTSISTSGSDFCALTMDEIAAMNFPTSDTTSISDGSPTSLGDHPHLRRHTYHPVTHVELVSKKKPPERSLRHERLQVEVPLLEGGGVGVTSTTSTSSGSTPEVDHPAPNSPPVGTRTTVKPVSTLDILQRLVTEEEAIMMSKDDDNEFNDKDRDHNKNTNESHNDEAADGAGDVESEDQQLDLADQALELGGAQVAKNSNNNDNNNDDTIISEATRDAEMHALKLRVRALEEQLEALQANVEDMTEVNAHLTQVVQEEEVQINVLETKAHYLTRELEHQDEQLATMQHEQSSPAISYYHPPTDSLQAQLVVAVEHEHAFARDLHATEAELESTRGQLKQAQEEAAEMLRQCQRLSHRMQMLQHDQQEDSERDQELLVYMEELQEALTVAQQQQPRCQQQHEQESEVDRLEKELRKARQAEAMVETVDEEEEEVKMMGDASLKQHLAQLEHDSERMAVLLHNLKQRDDYIVKLKATIEHLHHQLSAQPHEQATAEMRSLQQQLQHQAKERQQLQRTVHKQDEYIAKLKATIGTFKDEDEQALFQFANLQAKLKDISNDDDRTELLLKNIQLRDICIARLKATIGHLHHDEEEAHTKVAHLQEQLKAAPTEEERIALLMRYIHQRDDLVAQLKQQVALLHHDEEQALVQIATLQEQMKENVDSDEGHTEMTTLQEQLKDLEHEHEKVELLTTNIKKREEYISKLNSKLECLRHKLIQRSLRKTQPVVVEKIIVDEKAKAQIATLEHKLQEMENDETRIATLIKNIQERDAYITKLKATIDHMQHNRPPCEVVPHASFRTDDDVSTVSTMHEKLQHAYEEQDRQKLKVERLEHMLKEEKVHDTIMHDRMQSLSTTVHERDEEITSLRATICELRKEIAFLQDMPSAPHHAEAALHLRSMELQKEVDDLNKLVQYYKGPIKKEAVPRPRSTSLGAEPAQEVEMQMLRVECVHLRETIAALQRELDQLTSKVVHMDPDHRKTE